MRGNFVLPDHGRTKRSTNTGRFHGRKDVYMKAKYYSVTFKCGHTERIQISGDWETVKRKMDGYKRHLCCSKCAETTFRKHKEIDHRAVYMSYRAYKEHFSSYDCLPSTYDKDSKRILVFLPKWENFDEIFRELANRSDKATYLSETTETDKYGNYRKTIYYSDGDHVFGVCTPYEKISIEGRTLFEQKTPFRIDLDANSLGDFAESIVFGIQDRELEIKRLEELKYRYKPEIDEAFPFDIGE